MKIITFVFGLLLTTCTLVSATPSPSSQSSETLAPTSKSAAQLPQSDPRKLLPVDKPSPQITQVGRDYFIEVGRHEQTGAIFRIMQSYPNLVKSEPCLFNSNSKQILGAVPNSTNLLDDEVVLNLTHIGIREFEQRCPQVKTQTQRLQRQFGNKSAFLILIYLYREESWARYQGGSYFTDEVKASYIVTTAGAIELQSMTNRVKQQAAKDAQAQATLQAQQEQHRKAEDQRRIKEANLAKQQAEDAAASRKRYREFATKYGVREFVPLSLLTPNPYVYQGQVVAIPLQFDQMTSANTAKFVAGGLTQYWMVVAGVPRDLFRSRSPAIVAVRIGQREPLFNFAGVQVEGQA